MFLDNLKRKILEKANDEYPGVAFIEFDNEDKIIGLPECTTNDFIIALTELQDNNFIVDAITIGSDQIVSFGHLEITSRGRDLLRK